MLLFAFMDTIHVGVYCSQTVDRLVCAMVVVVGCEGANYVIGTMALVGMDTHGT